MWSLEKQITEATRKITNLEKENAELRGKRRVSESHRSGHQRVELVEGLVEGFVGIGLTTEEAEIAAGRKRFASNSDESDEKESPLAETFMHLGLTKEEARIAAGQRRRTPLWAVG